MENKGVSICKQQELQKKKERKKGKTSERRVGRGILQFLELILQLTEEILRFLFSFFPPAYLCTQLHMFILKPAMIQKQTSGEQLQPKRNKQVGQWR